mgnify:CR=1 FL=1
MKKWHWILVVIVILIVGWGFIRFIVGGSEDSWIKDEKGVYAKHGNPASIPDYVKEQQDVVSCALDLYNQEKNKLTDKATEFSSQCLGSCGDYAVDIVHVPRTNEDNLAENQCSDYREGKVSKFIELDKAGEIVRIA